MFAKRTKSVLLYSYICLFVNMRFLHCCKIYSESCFLKDFTTLLSSRLLGNMVMWDFLIECEVTDIKNEVAIT